MGNTTSAGADRETDKWFAVADADPETDKWFLVDGSEYHGVP